MIKSIFILLLGVVLFSSVSAQNALPGVKVKSLDGNTINIQDFGKTGKVTILSFWATWCSPCKKELDAISENWEEWKTAYNCELLAITVDDQRTLGKVGPMVEEKGWTYIMLSDVNKDLLRALSGQSVPFTVVLDKTGAIAFTHNGYTPGDENELEEKVKELAAK